MKMLVTGGAGFIGSHFVDHVLELCPDARVITYDALTYAGRREHLRRWENDPRHVFIQGDITDAALVQKVTEEYRPDIMVNFAAETHVDRSIHGTPPKFLRTNALGLQTLLEVARVYEPRLFLQVSCYDAETRAWTRGGLKSFHEIRNGDEVLTINPENGEVEIQVVQKVIIQDHDGEMVAFQNGKIDLLVTPNHRIFDDDFRFRSADSVTDGIDFPVGSQRGKDEEFFFISKQGIVRTEHLFYLIGLFLGDGFTAFQVKRTPAKSGLARKDFLSVARNELGRFQHVSFSTTHLVEQRSYRIFLDIPEGDRCRGKAEHTTLSSLGIKWHAERGKAGEHLYFTSRAFLEFFDALCGKGARNKRIPEFVFEYSASYLESLLDGLSDSDGCRRANGVICYTTVSEKLRDGIVELACRLGRSVSVGTTYSESRLSGRLIKGSCYRILIGNKAGVKSISQECIKRVSYHGKVWCIKVRNKNLLVERNGKYIFCGNTDEVYGTLAIGEYPWNEIAPVRPRSPYAASKAAGDLIALAYFHTYGVPVIVSRAENNYGPRQFPEKVIPFWILHAEAGQPLPVYGEGRQMRSWLHVLDHCRALFLLIEQGTPGEIYHVSAGVEFENIELAKKILHLMQRPEHTIEFVKDRPGHDFRYALDAAKIAALGFNPEFSGKRFSEGLQETIAWYRVNLSWVTGLMQENGAPNPHIASSALLLDSLRKKKMLIFGEGQLGTAYRGYFSRREDWKVVMAKDVDIRDRTAVETLIRVERPSIVLNTAAQTDIDWCERNQEEAFSVNTLGARNVARAAEDVGAYLVHLSSGCVMESKDANDIHTEDDPPSPLCFYSWTKVWADELLMDRVKHGTLKALIVRPRQLLSSIVSPRNALIKMLTYTKFIDTPNSCTIVEDLLNVTGQLIDRGATGIFNVVNPGILTPYRIAHVLKETIAPDMEFTKISKAELDAMTYARRVDAVLSVAKLASWGITLPDIESRLRSTCNDLKQNLTGETGKLVFTDVQAATRQKLRLVE